MSIATCLLIHGRAEEAAEFYTSLVPGSRVTDVMRQHDGTALLVSFELAGVPYQALNVGPDDVLTPAVSISLTVDGQDEVDRYWDALVADGGEESMCGWLTDRFGLSWQIVPRMLPRALQDPDPQRAQRAMQAMLQMRKIDIATVEAALAGEPTPA